MYTGTKKRERSMKSWRLKSVALTWLHGGHHTAPQYRNSGLWSALAATNAASTSPLRQAMPSPCAAAAAPGEGAAPVVAGAATCAASVAVGAAAAFGLGGSAVCGHAASASVRAR